jgi:hypothetical protein
MHSSSEGREAQLHAQATALEGREVKPHSTAELSRIREMT